LRVSSSPTDPDAEFSVGPVFSRMSLLKRQSTSTLPHVLRRLHVRVRARTDRPGERCVRLPSKSRPLSTHDGLIRTPPRPDRGSNRGSNPTARTFLTSCSFIAWPATVSINAHGSHTLTHSTNLNGPINVWLSPIIYQWLVLLRSTCLRMASAANWLGLGLRLGRR
jgi:hypothetical protein